MLIFVYNDFKQLFYSYILNLSNGTTTCSYLCSWKMVYTNSAHWTPREQQFKSFAITFIPLECSTVLDFCSVCAVTESGRTYCEACSDNTKKPDLLGSDCVSKLTLWLTFDYFFLCCFYEIWWSLIFLFYFNLLT